MIGKAFGLIWKGIKGFALFWVDFIIGDSPEIAIGVAVIFGISLALHESPVVAAFVIPAAVVLLLIYGVWHGRNR